MDPRGQHRSQEPAWWATLLVVIAVAGTCLYAAARLRASVTTPGAPGSAAPAAPAPR
ncbi:MAG: hypothetical protein U0359_12785 [Byssovorax sp.]